MIIGKGKPEVYEFEDRWGRPSGSYGVREPGRIGQALWEKLWEYENLDAIVFSHNGRPRQVSADEYARVVEATIRKCPQVSTVWEFNADTLDCRDKVRMTAVFNRSTLAEWSWWDLHVRYPLARAKAWWLNHTRKPIDYDLLDVHGRVVLKGLKDAKLTPERQKLLERIEAGDINEDCGP